LIYNYLFVDEHLLWFERISMPEESANGCTMQQEGLICRSAFSSVPPTTVSMG
jgi:hypothetical protein